MRTLLAIPLALTLWALSPSNGNAQTLGSPKPVDQSQLPSGYADPVPQSSLAPLNADTLSLSKTDRLPFSKSNPFSQHPQIDTLVTKWAKYSPDRNALIEALNKRLLGQKPLGDLYVDMTHVVKPNDDLYASFITAKDPHGKVQTGVRITFHNTSSIR